jgi:hypothetical protein
MGTGPTAHTIRPPGREGPWRLRYGWCMIVTLLYFTLRKAPGLAPYPYRRLPNYREHLINLRQAGPVPQRRPAIEPHTHDIIQTEWKKNCYHQTVNWRWVK